MVVGKWHVGFCKFAQEYSKVSKLELWRMSFAQSRKCMTLKFTEELCVMTMKNYTKIEEELTCRFKIDIRNFTNFHPSTQKSPEHFLTNFGGWSHSFPLTNWDWKNKNIYLKINIFILTFSLSRHPLGYSDQCCHYTETSPLIYRANQWDGFYTMAKLDWNKLSFF